MRILALEASTSSAKAMLFDSETNQFEDLNHLYSKDYSNFDVIDQAEEVYQEVMALGRELLNGRSVDMIALGGTWHSILLCDKNMRPVSPVYQWTYMGAKDICAEHRKDKAYTEHFYHTTGCMVNAIYPAFKVELLRQMGFDVDHSYLLSQGSYNTYRMTGKRVSTHCLSSGSGFMNLHTMDYFMDVLDYNHISREQVSELISSDVDYPLQKEAADLLGVKEGIPVIPCNSDGGLNQVGVGAIRKGIATFSVGTSGAIRLTTQEPVIPEKPSTWCYYSPKGFLSGAATNGCCNCTDWVKNRLFPKGTSYAEIENGVIDENDTPIFLPFLFGERCPGWNDERRGGFYNLKPSHTAADMYRAAQEGVLFNLYHCYRILADINGAPSELMLSGGIIKSKVWTQMAADIFGVKLSVNDVSQGSLLGAVVMGMERLGIIKDVRDYVPDIVKTVLPNPEKKEMYEKKFQLYLECYEKNN